MANQGVRVADFRDTVLRLSRKLAERAERLARKARKRHLFSRHSSIIKVGGNTGIISHKMMGLRDLEALTCKGLVRGADNVG